MIYLIKLQQFLNVCCFVCEYVCLCVRCYACNRQGYATHVDHTTKQEYNAYHQDTKRHRRCQVNYVICLLRFKQNA